MNILHLEQSCYSAEAIDKIKARGQLNAVEISSQEELQVLLQNDHYNVIFTRLGLYLGEKELSTQNNLRYIVTPTTGLNHLDLDYLQQRGIRVVSLKGESAFLNSIQSTAEHTWMLLLSLIRNLQPALDSVRQNSWDRVPYLAEELNTRTLGIIGFGRLGKILLRYARAFDMQVLLHDIDESAFTEESLPFRTGLNSLLAQSDYVLLQADYRESNRHLFGKAHFQKMKKGAYFINTARGELVDEPALLDALCSGQLRGAALDVLDGDSAWGTTPAGHPLVTYAQQNDNLLITPHMGGYGRISIEKTRDFITDKWINTLI